MQIVSLGEVLNRHKLISTSSRILTLGVMNQSLVHWPLGHADAFIAEGKLPPKYLNF